MDKLRHFMLIVFLQVGCLSDMMEAVEAEFTCQQETNRLVISYAGKLFGEFVFRDEKIYRPYFANLRSAHGIQVTRNHPPVKGQDDIDHDTMHPGLWLGFGDINGQDFWRNQGRIEHVGFRQPPRVDKGRLTFATRSQLLTTEKIAFCELDCDFEISVYPEGMMIVWDASFQSSDVELIFGDQEEMGFGARVATPIAEKNGGAITSASGKNTAKDTWGQAAAWCDYEGTIDGRRAGITLMTDPRNFRECWWHNRNYGVFVANAFGRGAMKQGEPSQMIIPPKQPFRLRFAAFIHDEADYDPASAYLRYMTRDKQ